MLPAVFYLVNNEGERNLQYEVNWQLAPWAAAREAERWQANL